MITLSESINIKKLFVLLPSKAPLFMTEMKGILQGRKLRILSRSSSLLTLLFVLSLFGALFFPNLFNLNLPNVLGKKVETPVESLNLNASVFADYLHPVYSSPKKLMIDTLKIDLSIVPVGVDSFGHLETPKDWGMGGWYQNGARPGETGNFLLNAHYDDNLGRPAAFYRLKNIKAGDKVSVLDSFGLTYDYKVVRVYYIKIDDPDRAKVFEAFEKDKSAMTLITCGGVWIQGEGTYNKRLVVNAELIQN